MALKLIPEYTISLSAGGTVAGEVIGNGGTEHVIEHNWTPKKQELTPADGAEIRRAQDALRAIAVQLRLLMDIEAE